MKLKAMWLGALAALLAGPAFAAEPSAATPPISQTQLLAKLDAKGADVIVLDVRTPAEFAAGHVPGAHNISHDQLAAKLPELQAWRDKELVLYCRSGRRSALAEETLRAAGFTRLLHLEGDYLAWEAEKRPVESSPAQ